MSVELDGDVVRLSGECGLEDCERLLALFAGGSGHRVDLSGAGPIHTAVFQVLQAKRPALSGTPRDDFFTTWLLPLLLPEAYDG